MALKHFLPAVLALSALTVATSARADLYPDFTVNSTVFGGPRTFVADKITGNYVEVVTFGAGTFNISLYFQAGQFVANDGTAPLSSGGAFGTGLGSNYGLYAIFQGSGTFTTGATTTFSLTPGGSLTTYIDVGNNNNTSAVVSPTTAPGAFVIPGSADDVVIATGSGLSGQGNLSCSTGNNCGSFGQTTSFNLNALGSTFFIQPIPFYSLSLQSGQFNGFAATPGTTQTLNGSMDVIFQRVPEPSSLALVGLALVGAGAIGRRSQKQKRA